ncbi:MAG TPA: tetratricopeptide repeat protein, partial [Polyangiales bacterium]
MLQTWRLRPATCATLGLVACVIAWASARAERHGLAYRPARPDEVVLAALRRDPAAGERARLREALRAQPHDQALALRLAQAELNSARKSGDVRPLGRAEALLAPFAEAPSAELLVLRATVAQARHDFTAALTDLQRALSMAPDNAQARLTQAALFTVQGRYTEARASCAQLSAIAPDYVPLLCHANLDGYTGARGRAMQLLEAAAVQLPERGAQAWAGSLLCEHAFWAGELERAERACARALALDPTDRYTRALHLDVLLEAGTPER